MEGRLQVVDQATAQRLIVDLRNGQFTERHPVEMARRVWDITLGPSKYVASGAVTTRHAAGFPLHVYDERGRWQVSFGVGEPAFRGELMHLLVRRLALADSSSFWAAPMNEYRLERWTFGGRRLAELVGKREWFTSWLRQPVVRSIDHPPETYVVGLTSNASGLWILFAVSAPQWSEALDTLRDQMGNRLIRPGARYRDSVLELVDPDRGELLATTRLAGSWSGFADPRHLWRTWIDANGQAHTIVAAFHLSTGDM